MLTLHWLRLLTSVLVLLVPAAAVVAQDGSVRITGLTTVDGRWRLAWESAGAGVAYSVQAREMFGGGLWIGVRGEQAPPVAGTEFLAPVGGVGAQRFFRVVSVVASERGALRASSHLGDFSQIQLAFLLSLNQIPVVPSFGVRVHKVVYESIDPLGGRTLASGVVALPVGASTPLPLVTYQHGTLVDRDDAPTADLTGEALVGVILASTGYAALVPDFLGFGDSTGRHPYHHAGSEATACVDFLRAGRSFCLSNGVALSGKLFLCGYSQGGHATMALHRELESYHSAEFPVTASAPMAGAYDLSGVTVDDFLSGRPLPNPYYFPYLLAAYQEVYRFTNQLGDLLRAPYDTNLPPLLDGTHSGAEINAVLPANPVTILRPEIEAAFRADPGHPFRLALRDNDLISWTPVAPLRLYHCAGDLDVSPENSRAAFEAFQARGATNVVLMDPSPLADHAGCAFPSLLAAKEWFDQLK